MSEKIEKRDERGNIIYYKDFKGLEYWSEYDENNKEISCRNADGNSYRYEYDEYSRIIYYQNICGNGEKVEAWYKYDEYERRTIITKQEFKQIKKEKEQKEFLSRKEISRFDLMEV